MLIPLAAVLLAVGIAAQDPPSTWSRFRGPNGTGIADVEGLPTRFGRADDGSWENLVWRTPLPPGHSSPVLSADAVFVTAERDTALLTICVDRATGAVRWQREAPRDRVTKVDGRNHPASPSPVVAATGDGELRVVTFFADSGLHCYDAIGELQWRVPLGPFDNVYGMGASPIVAGEAVILACDQNLDSHVLAVSLADGELLWKTARPHALSGHCTPVMRTDSEHGPEILLPGSFRIDAYDPADGRSRWWFGGLSFEMKSVPLLHGDVVYVNGYGSPFNQPGQTVALADFAAVLASDDANGDGAMQPDEIQEPKAKMFFEFCDLDHDGSLTASEWSVLQNSLASQNGMLAIRPGGAGELPADALLWDYRRSVPQLPSPLIYDDVLYMLNDQGGILVAFRPKTGEVLERGRLADAVDSYYASPVAGDGKVYFTSLSGIVTVLPAGGSFEPLATNRLGETCYATPALAPGRLFVRTVDALMAFGDGE